MGRRGHILRFCDGTRVVSARFNVKGGALNTFCNNANVWANWRYPLRCFDLQQINPCTSSAKPSHSILTAATYIYITYVYNTYCTMCTARVYTRVRRCISVVNRSDALAGALKMKEASKRDDRWIGWNSVHKSRISGLFNVWRSVVRCYFAILQYLVFTSLYLDPFYELMKLAVVKFFRIIEWLIERWILDVRIVVVN